MYALPRKEITYIIASLIFKKKETITVRGIFC